MALIMGTLAMLVSFMAWSSLSPLAKIFATDLQVDLGQQKVLVAVPVLLGSIMRLPMGILSDKYGGKKVYLILMGFTLIPLIATPLVIHSAMASQNPSNYYGIMLFVALLLGMAGTSFAVSLSYVSVWFPPEKQGRILGITGLGNIGNAIAALLFPTLAGPNKSISNVYIFLVFVTLLFLLVFALTTQEMPINPTKNLKEVLSIAKNIDTWYLTLFYMLTFGSLLTFGTLIPTLLSNPKTFNFSLITAGLLSALFLTVATLLWPVGVAWADKFKPIRLLIISFIGIFIAACLLFFAALGQGNAPLFIFAIILEATFAGLGNGILFHLVSYVVKENTGTVTDFVGAAGGLGGFFPSLVVAAFGDDLSFSFLFLGGFTLICLLALYWLYFKGDY